MGSSSKSPEQSGGLGGEAKLTQVLSAQEQAEAINDLIPLGLQNYLTGCDPILLERIRKISLNMPDPLADEWSRQLALIIKLQNTLKQYYGDPGDLAHRFPEAQTNGTKPRAIQDSLLSAYDKATQFFIRVAFAGGGAIRSVSLGMSGGRE